METSGKLWNWIVLLAFVASTPSIADADELLKSESVWLPEVEQLYQSDVTPPSWLTEPSDYVLVKGLAGDGQQSAIHEAIERQILPRLEEQVGSWSESEKAIARRHIQHRLERSAVIVNRFEQPFYKMVDGERYDAFTREAILLNLSDKNMQRIQRNAKHAVHGNSRMRKHTIAVSFGVLATMFLGCWFAYTVLDRLTRGYYVSWLRVMTATVFVVSAGLTLHLARAILRAL